jgi:hypothetical protein
VERSGSLEQRVRRLEYEASAQRRELNHLRRRVDGSSGGEREIPGRPTRGGSFAVLETVPGAGGGTGRGGETIDEPGAAVEPRGGEQVQAEPMGAGGGVTFAQEAGTSGTGEGERWGARLRLDFVGVRGWEWWLNKVGIALLLFGVAFLFKFSWDRGWLQVLLTPWVRVGLGTTLGCALILFGLRIGERRSFAAVLLGGGIGTLYITSFAAYGVLDLIPHAAAFAAMAVVTALAFALSVRQDEPVLSLVATVGGFATPFVLYTEDGTVAGLVLYTSVLLGGTAAIYLLRGWRSLLAISSVGTWAVLYAAVVQWDPPVAADATGWPLQSGVVFAWLTLWLVPTAREVLRERDPGAWSLPGPGPLARTFGDGGARSSAGLAYALSIGTPLLALVFTGRIWSLDEPALGYVALAGAGVYAGVALLLRPIDLERNVSYVCGLVAVVLATIGIVAIFEGDTLFAALALEAVALHFVARRFSDRIVSWASRALYGFVTLWLAYRLIAGISEHVLWLPGGRADALGVDAFLDLAVIALLPLIAHFERRTIAAEVYRFLASGALSLWMARELLTFGDGVSYVVLAWTLYAVALFVLARRFESVALRVATQVQLVTLGALVLGRLLYTLAVGPQGTAVFNPGGITDLLAILVIGGYPLVLARRPVLAVAYRLVAHAMLLTWFWGQLSSLPSGDAYVTIAWGLLGAALLVVGLRVPAADVVRIGLGTLFLVVAKLFLWDLAGVEAIWRVLLFLGFGGLFLLLSYYLPSLWRGGDGERGIRGSRAA